MKADSIRFIRKILAGNEINYCRPLTSKPQYMGRVIDVKPGTLLDDMGIKRIYCDKVGSNGCTTNGWLENKFIGNRSIFINGKHKSSSHGCTVEFNIPQKDNKLAFYKLEKFFKMLYEFRK